MNRWDDHSGFGAVDESPGCDAFADWFMGLLLVALAVLLAVVAVVAVIG